MRWRGAAIYFQIEIVPYYENYCFYAQKKIYRKTSNIRRTLVGNKIVDHSDIVGASSPVGAAPTTYSFST